MPGACTTACPSANWQHSSSWLDRCTCLCIHSTLGSITASQCQPSRVHIVCTSVPSAILYTCLAMVPKPPTYMQPAGRDLPPPALLRTGLDGKRNICHRVRLTMRNIRGVPAALTKLRKEHRDLVLGVYTKGKEPHGRWPGKAWAAGAHAAHCLEAATASLLLCPFRCYGGIVCCAMKRHLLGWSEVRSTFM
jgi:hypothetical protein